ncbi:MAG: ParA family protein [Leptospiraceae bacterium]|nr:ParA family protein [Leptospiraceae bacterium]
MIVSFVQTKGGTGKSTLSMNIAFSAIVSGKFASVALVELDPQGTLQSWWKSRIEEGRDSGKVSFHHISSTQKEVVQDGISSIANHNELLILDIPGESTSRLHTKFACAYSDKVIIPMRTSTNDEAAFRDNLLPLVKEILKLNTEKKGGFQILPSFTNAQANSKRVIEYFTDILPNYIHCLPVVYPQRSIYENFNRDGMNLIEFAESLKNNKKAYAQVSKAVEDIEIIAQAIFDLENKNGST